MSIDEKAVTFTEAARIAGIKKDFLLELLKKGVLDYEVLDNTVYIPFQQLLVVMQGMEQK